MSTAAMPITSSAATREPRAAAQYWPLPRVGSAKPGRHSSVEHDQERIFGDAAEDVRRNQPGQDAADHAAERNPHVVAGQVTAAADGGARARHGTSARRRRTRSRWITICSTIDSIGIIRIAMTRNSTNAGWTATTSQCGMNGLGLEDDDEGQQVERQRDRPEQRHRRDVGRDVGGDRDQQAGRHRRQRDPDRGVAPARRRAASAASRRRRPPAAGWASAASGSRSPPPAAIST